MLVPLLEKDGSLSGLLVAGRGQPGIVRDCSAVELETWTRLCL